MQNGTVSANSINAPGTACKQRPVGTEDHSLRQLLESLSPQQCSWLQSLDPNLLISALQSMQRTLAIPEIEPQDKRRAIRRRVVLGAKIIYNGRTCVVDCQISNLSETGCKLKIHGGAHIPTQFTLNFNASKEVRECEVAWWDERTAGVRFLN